MHGGFVVQVEVVQIEATEVAFDLQDALIAPMVG
ncbi:hypothetical protein [Synechococcus phage S-EIVl]|nr:hypothetical protein [Synechococcus phage S-EIVl]